MILCSLPKKSSWHFFHCSTFNPLSARVFTIFGHSLLEDRVLHEEAWLAKLLGTHLNIQVHKKVKSWRDNSPLVLKGLKEDSNMLFPSISVKNLQDT